MPETKKITVGIIAVFLVSIYFLYLGLNVSVRGGFLEGACFLIAGLLAFPGLSKFIRKQFNVELTTSLKVVAIILLVFLGYFVQFNRVKSGQFQEYSSEQNDRSGRASSNIESCIQKGKSAFENQNYELAIKTFQECLASTVKNTKAYTDSYELVMIAYDQWGVEAL